MLFDTIMELYGVMGSMLSSESNGKQGLDTGRTEKEVLDLVVEPYGLVTMVLEGKDERIQSFGINGCGKKRAEEERFRENPDKDQKCQEEVGGAAEIFH